MSTPKSICVFCGARNNVPEAYLETAATFGRMMAEQGIQLVYGGGDCGMMGAVANAVMEHEGKVTGVFPKHLRNIEVEHRGLTKIMIVDSMHERKKLMFDLSDAFVTFPGGFGTMDETFEIITWKQLQLHAKPIVIYNHDGYWQPWVDLTEKIIDKGFASAETRNFYKVVDRLDAIIDAVSQVEM